MVLGLMASQGPMHGHQIKVIAKQTEVSEWGGIGIGIGALYRELRNLDAEGLVRPVTVEQVGRRPVRTIYEITDTGLKELRTLREKAICELRFGPDSLSVALLFGRVGDPVELERFLVKRREELSTTIADIDAERTEHIDQQRISPLDAALFRRQAMLLEAELRWLEEFQNVIVAEGTE